MKETAQPAMESREGARSLPAHLIELDSPAWAMWRWFGVRGAGFPIARALRLASPEAAASADRALNAEQDLATACAEAEQVVSRELDRISAEGGDTRPLLKLRKRLRTGHPPESAEGRDHAVSMALDACQAARQA